MIIKADITHKKQLADLWCEAFGDKKEDVLLYLDFLLKYFYIYEENGTIYAMTAVLPLSHNGKNGGYIYALATRATMRGRGISTRLLNYIKALPEYDFFVLVPQNESLFDFYKRFGFAPVSCVEGKNILAADAIDDTFKCVCISADEYADFRKNHFGSTLIKWDVEVLDFAKAMYGGNYYFISENGVRIGVCFCFKSGENVVVKELITKNREAVSKKIAAYFGAKNTIAFYPEWDSPPSAMIYPPVSDKIYFAIALD